MTRFEAATLKEFEDDMEVVEPFCMEFFRCSCLNIGSSSTRAGS
jgi:hypothetical protein